jgi:excisionase family DNA binding protein
MPLAVISPRTSEIDPLLTAENVAHHPNSRADWGWDQSAHRSPLLPAIRVGDGRFRRHQSQIGQLDLPKTDLSGHPAHPCAANQEGSETVATEAWMITTEAARHLRIKPRTLAQWVRSGKIPGHKLSGNQRVTWRFLRHELDAICARHPLSLLKGGSFEGTATQDGFRPLRQASRNMELSLV